MRKIKTGELFEMFFLENKEYFDSLGFDKTYIRKACLTPWKFFKKSMNNGNLDTIRIKYIGRFEVNEYLVKRAYNRNEKNFKENKIDREMYFRNKKVLTKKLKKFKDNE